MAGTDNGFPTTHEIGSALGQSVHPDRNCWPRAMRFGLVPKCDRRHQIVPFDEAIEFIICKLLGAFVLNLDAQRFFERDRIGNVESVSRASIPRLVSFPKWRAVERTLLLSKTPTVAEIILCARPPQPWLSLAINKEKIISFSIPT